MRGREAAPRSEVTASRPAVSRLCGPGRPWCTCAPLDTLVLGSTTPQNGHFVRRRVATFEGADVSPRSIHGSVPELIQTFCNQPLNGGIAQRSTQTICNIINR